MQMRYAILGWSETFLMSDAKFKSVINNQLKDFPKWSAFAKNRRIICIKIWSMKDDFAILLTGFWKSLIFQLFLHVMSPMNGEAGAVFTIMVACLALCNAIMKDQVKQLELQQRQWVSTKKPRRTGKSQIVKRSVNYSLWHLYICSSVFSILTFCFAEFDTCDLSCGVLCFV